MFLISPKIRKLSKERMLGLFEFGFIHIKTTWSCQESNLIEKSGAQKQES